MKKRMPSALIKYRGLLKKKKSHCAGRTSASEVKKAAAAYVSAAVKGGQTKAEATHKANKILSRACGIAAKAAKRRAPHSVSSSSSVGKIKTHSTRKRSTTARRRRA